MDQREWQNPVNNVPTNTVETANEKNVHFGIEQFFQNLDWFSKETNWKSEKWTVSSSKTFDQMWISSQKRKFNVNLFEYVEKFENSLFIPALFGTRKFLLNFLKGNDVKNVALELNEIFSGLEGIWFNKYRNLFQKFFAKTVVETKAPEYFFYKYYYQFLTALRTVSILLITDVIIPNIVLANAPYNISEQYEIASVDYYGNIRNSITIFSNIIEDVFKKTIDQYNSELVLKGRNWEINYEETDFDFATIIAPNIGADLEVWIDNYRQKLLVNN